MVGIDKENYDFWKIPPKQVDVLPSKNQALH